MKIFTLRYSKTLRISLFAIFLLTCNTSIAQFTGGSGTLADPYQISNVTQLQAMNTALDKHFILTQNIDATVTSTWNSGQGFEPIGATSSTPFIGSLNGNGYKIIKLYIARQSTVGVGLIGHFNNSIGSISNLGLDSVTIIGGERTGALVGNKNGIVKNCYSTGSVFGGKSTGGLIGRNGLNVEDSYSSCNVNGYEEVGGLVGSGASIYNCYATGNVLASFGDVGGIVGEVSSNGGTIYNTYATGNVTCNNTVGSVGGFIGRMQYGFIDLCYSTGNVTGNAVVGGFAGVINAGTIKRSYTKCKMTLAGGTFPFGGFIAENESNIIDCYADVNMSYTGNNISTKLGGFAGENKEAGRITNSYSIANISATNGNRAAFIHTNELQGFDTSKTFGCYWNSDSSSGLLGIFLDQTNSQITTGLTDSQMKSAINFSGWNFDTIWTITEGQTYPELRRPGSTGGCTNTFADDSVVACDQYTWINGVTYFVNADTPQFTLMNAAGCDSIVTLKLTIYSISNAVIVNANVLTAKESGATYQWIDCSNNTAIANQTNQTFTATQTGNYKVIITKDICSDTSDCINVVISSINNSSTKKINIYPNPSSGTINFIDALEGRVEVYNNISQVVFVKNMEKESSINLSSLPAGIYFLKLNSTDGNIYQSKIIIQQ